MYLHGRPVRVLSPSIDETILRNDEQFVSIVARKEIDTDETFARSMPVVVQNHSDFLHDDRDTIKCAEFRWYFYKYMLMHEKHVRWRRVAIFDTVVKCSLGTYRTASFLFWRIDPSSYNIESRESWRHSTSKKKQIVTTWNFNSNFKFNLFELRTLMSTNYYLQ